MKSPVTITGVGCLCAAGKNHSDAMHSLLRGEVKAGPSKRIHTSHPHAYPLFEIEGFEEDPNRLRTCSLGLFAAESALKDAGLDPTKMASGRVGIIMGTTVGCTLSDEDFGRERLQGRPGDFKRLTRILESNPARAIARRFGFEGPCQNIVNACCSGTDAIGLGAEWIRQGLCDCVLAGGADELSRITLSGFLAMKIVDPGPCRPFDRTRKGLNLGEGAAILLLESDAHLHDRKGKARGHILGFGSACDAHHPTAPHPEGRGLMSALHRALQESGLEPKDLAFINAHGTGTPDNDMVEAHVLAKHLPGVPYFSTKGGTGHTLGAAGAIEAALTLACLEAGEIPASLGFKEADPAMPGPPNRERSRIQKSRALSQSLAFGGNNSVLAIGKT